MLKYILARVVHTIPVLLGVSIAIFGLLYLIPGDPIRVMASPQASQQDIQNLRERWGLDDPLHVQYGRWLAGALRGDLGESVRMRLPVTQILWPRYLNTVRLTLASMAVAVVGGLTIGVLASVGRNSIFDTLSMVLAIGGFSIPPFWLGLMLILLFSVRLGWLPSGTGSSARHLVLPAVSLGLATMALIARMTRSAMLEVLGRDYIRTARAKGLAEWLVMTRHALKNALMPVVTVIGLQFGVLMAGAVVTEVVFSYPGLGWLLVNGILNRDFPVVRGALLLTTVTFVAINLMTDLVYAYLDPRIRY